MIESVWSTFSELARLHGKKIAARDLRAESARVSEKGTFAVAASSLAAHGFKVEINTIESSELSRLHFPVGLLLKTGEVVVCLERSESGFKLWHAAPESDSHEDNPGVCETLSMLELQERFAGSVVQVSADILHEAARQGDAGQTHRHWFWSVFTLLRHYYVDCAVAAVLVNLLTLAASMFSMNVYDRVIPTGAVHTLWVLAIGVFLAALVEFVLRTLRAKIVDDAGKKADLMLSSVIFRQTLNLKAKDRPQSSGQYAGNLREFDSVREFVSSTTLVAMTDLPFVFLFMAVIGFMGGVLMWVVVAACILILAAGYFSQLPIKRSIERYQYENSQKLAFMVETLERLETVQALGAFPTVQGRWERLCAITARSSMTSRLVSAIAMNFTQFVQQFANTALIITGVYLILEGKLTTGALIGCSILSSRAIAPLAQIAGLMTRWQQAKIAYDALNKVMNTEGLSSTERTYAHFERSRGEILLKDVAFAYPRTENKVLHLDVLKLNPGEVTAVMGPVGSGKSTLLRVLAGLNQADGAQYLLDGIDIKQISPADFRAQVSWVGQDAVLFRGTLRENLLFAAPLISEKRFQEVLAITGVQQLANSHPAGLDMQLGENGQALSGGQRQMVALARALLSDAPLVLLDEPTSAFDGVSEHHLIQALQAFLVGRTVVIATHRPAPLEWVSRLIILDAGRIVADGPRDQVLQAVKQGLVRRASAEQPQSATVSPAQGVASA